MFTVDSILTMTGAWRHWLLDGFDIPRHSWNITSFFSVSQIKATG